MATGKRLVVCCDGTWNFADQSSATNVTKVAASIRSQADQRVYYDAGVGTDRWMRLRGGAFGKGLSANVLEAYSFLIDTYEPGDMLYLFGFSRGAFTVRSLAGLVRNCGILRPEHDGMIEEAWALYRSRRKKKKPKGTASAFFRRTYAYETGIHFIGVWDTVGALGVPRPRWLPRRGAFHDTELSGRVKGAFQALAIDEQRRQFRPTLWHQQPDAATEGQELKQVWFAGVHKDVGGGYPERGLSDVALLWMIQQASRYGLEFGPSEAEPLETPPESSIFQMPPTPNGMGAKHNSRKGLYRLAPRLHRPIGKAANNQGLLDGCEYLSQTAKVRYDNDASYRLPDGPRRLNDYLTQDEVNLEPMPMTVDDALPDQPLT
jgi:uncharacterized protein (DUF2235 family)